MTSRPLASGVAALAAVALLAACSSEPEEATGSGHGAHDPSPQSQSTDAQSGHNAADVMFAQMMLPHHEQALEMGDILLAKSGVPDDVATLAQTIKDAQGPEITQLTTWLKEWNEPTEVDMSGHHMDGMVSPEDLQRLRDTPGPEAARLFLQQMIAHHEGAVTMAREEIDSGQHGGSVQMARTIVDSQQKEIDTMKAMLAE